MNRYKTRWQIAVTREVAEEIAASEAATASPGMVLDPIRETKDVELLHCYTQSGGWAWWSDGRITGCPAEATGSRPNAPEAELQLRAELRARQCLSDAAIELITGCRGSDSGTPAVGWAQVARIDRIVECVPLLVGPRRPKHYHRLEVERLRVVYTDGATGTLYRTVEGYFEGYRYEVTAELPDDAPRIWIVSGEGDGPGHRERYDDPMTATALAARISRERAGGDRWCRVEIEAEGYGPAPAHVDDLVARGFVAP
jgi:hypothetical protein